MKNFFTSDTHFFHKNVIKYCNRPFRDVDEMNRVMIENWNSKVGKTDIVYHIGDFAFTKDLEFSNQLNGSIILIRGNHDKDNVLSCKKIVQVHGLLDIKIQGNPTTLCHYPMRRWNMSHYGSWHLFGHLHNTRTQFPGKVWNVGVDINNFMPLSEQEIIKIMSTLPENDHIKKYQDA